MNAEMIAELYSHICGQSRSFVADGTLLPVDQRCLGLYVGALLTAIWLLGTGVWRRGLPGRGVVALHAGLLFTAMLGGLHVIDPGPLWRLMLGFWTGHVALLWLVGAAVEMGQAARPDGAVSPAWRGSDSLQGLVFPLALAILAWAFPPLLALGWTFWTVAATLGVATLGAALAAAGLALARRALVGLRMA
jgi:hypothetical protein